MSFAWGAWCSVTIFFLFCSFYGVLFYRLLLKHRVCRMLIGTSYFEYFSLNFSVDHLRRKFTLFLAGYFFLLLALMRPQWTQREEVVTQSTRDLFIALDISKSMLSEDMGRTRLTIAKKKIKNLLHHLSCERVGLILFSGSTFVQCPLTRDLSAFYMFLDHIDVETISSGSTALDQALLTSVKAFENTGPRKNRLLLVVTDGEDFSNQLTDATRKAREAGIRVCTLGIGSEQGGPIPLYDTKGKRTGHQRDRDGSIVISKLNDSLLRTISNQTGGTYIKATKNASDIKRLVQYIQSFETEAIDNVKMSRLQEQYPFILIISFLCLALEWIL
jgi:Ca-activated chloride channel homolog